MNCVYSFVLDIIPHIALFFNIKFIFNEFLCFFAYFFAFLIYFVVKKSIYFNKIGFYTIYICAKEGIWERKKVLKSKIFVNMHNFEGLFLTSISTFLTLSQKNKGCPNFLSKKSRTVFLVCNKMIISIKLLWRNIILYQFTTKIVDMENNNETTNI